MGELPYNLLEAGLEIITGLEDHLIAPPAKKIATEWSRRTGKFEDSTLWSVEKMRPGVQLLPTRAMCNAISSVKCNVSGVQCVRDERKKGEVLNWRRRRRRNGRKRRGSEEVPGELRSRPQCEGTPPGDSPLQSTVEIQPSSWTDEIRQPFSWLLLYRLVAGLGSTNRHVSLGY